MGYRLRYTFSVDFVPSGTNPGYSPSGTTLPFTGNAQTLTFQQPVEWPVQRYVHGQRHHRAH